MDPRSDLTGAATVAIPSPQTPLSSTSIPEEGRFVPGTLLRGRYRIIGLLGQGGMGEVRVARQVSHPNVCRVYDIGEILIMDFGLAAIAGQLNGAEARSGTPAYMALEQLNGTEVTARSDIYAFGLVLPTALSIASALPGGDPLVAASGASTVFPLRYAVACLVTLLVCLLAAAPLKQAKLAFFKTQLDSLFPANCAGDALQVGLFVFFVLFILGVILRKNWLAAIVAALISSLIENDLANSLNWQIELAVYVLLFSTLILCLLRFGLVVAISAVFFLNTINDTTVGTDLATWYAPTGLITMALILAITLFAFRRSIAGPTPDAL